MKKIDNNPTKDDLQLPKEKSFAQRVKDAPWYDSIRRAYKSNPKRKTKEVSQEDAVADAMGYPEGEKAPSVQTMAFGSKRYDPRSDTSKSITNCAPLNGEKVADKSGCPKE